MIYHVVPLDGWLVAPDRPYAPRSLAEDGFVHCSPDEATTLAVATARFRYAVGPLMVLLIDEGKLDVMVHWEAADPAPPPGVPAATRFPHVLRARQPDRGGRDDGGQSGTRRDTRSRSAPGPDGAVTGTQGRPRRGRPRAVRRG